MTEALRARPILILLSIGIAQLAFIFRAQMDLDYACFRAARKAIVMANTPGWLEESKKEAVRVLRPSILQVLKNPSLSAAFDFFSADRQLQITEANPATEKHSGHALS